MNRPIYSIRFLYNGVRYEHEVYAFDFDITYPDCLTMYFKDASRIVVDEDGIDEVEITCIR